MVNRFKVEPESSDLISSKLAGTNKCRDFRGSQCAL